MLLHHARDEPDSPRAAAWATPVTIRLAGPDDGPAIAQVAGRDSLTPPSAPRLVAERDGVVEAAISLRDGEVVADPFVHTAELVELLRTALPLDLAEGGWA